MELIECPILDWPASSYLIPAGHCGGGLHLLRDHALLLSIRVVGRRCGHRLFLQLLGLGVLAQILMRGRRSGRDSRGSHIPTYAARFLVNYRVRLTFNKDTH